MLCRNNLVLNDLAAISVVSVFVRACCGVQMLDFTGSRVQNCPLAGWGKRLGMGYGKDRLSPFGYAPNRAADVVGIQGAEAFV